MMHLIIILIFITCYKFIVNLIICNANLYKILFIKNLYKIYIKIFINNI